MELLDKLAAAEKAVCDYFGYAHDWKVLPFDDSTDKPWYLTRYQVCFADSEEELESQSGNYYENEIFTYVHLPKHVYRGPDYTMVVVDTHCDGNKFLQVFANALERKPLDEG